MKLALLWCFSPNDLTGQKLSATGIELSLVVFRDPGRACLVERSGWTRDVNVFLQWLAAISFTGGGFDEAAIGEGLYEALMMFTCVPGSQVQNHCILVGASNPYPLRTSDNQISNVELGEFFEVTPLGYLIDAETVAKRFAQCSISLSVISPKQPPKLIEIYNAGNPNSGAAYLSVIGNPQFLVLLSENFKEACAVLESDSFRNIHCATVEVPMGDIQGTVSINQSVTGISQANLSGTQIGQRGVAMNQNIINELGSSNMSFESGTMVLNPGMPQQGLTEMQPLEVFGSSTTNMLLPQQTSGGVPGGWMIIWKGTLSIWERGHPSPAIITELHGYRNPITSDNLVANWPQKMQIRRLIPKHYMDDKRNEGISEILFFRALNMIYLNNLHSRNLCALIQLPSQTLLLGISNDCNLIGMLLHVETNIYEELIPIQQKGQQFQLQQQHSQHQHPPTQQQFQQQQQQQHSQQQQNPPNQLHWQQQHSQPQHPPSQQQLQLQQQQQKQQQPSQQQPLSNEGLNMPEDEIPAWLNSHRQLTTSSLPNFDNNLR